MDSEPLGRFPLLPGALPLPPAANLARGILQWSRGLGPEEAQEGPYRSRGQNSFKADYAGII